MEKLKPSLVKRNGALPGNGNIITPKGVLVQREIIGLDPKYP